MRNVLIVLSGPSGVGKGTIAKILVERNKGLGLSISCTTRGPRNGEQDGREYFFISKVDFEKKIQENGFLEYSEHFENFYGTPKDYVEKSLETKDVILEIDVNGGLNAKNNYPNAILVMIVPPSLEELKNRLVARGTETEEKINLRLQRIDYELSKKDLYDYVVVNDNLSDAIVEIEQIISKEKLK